MVKQVPVKTSLLFLNHSVPENATLRTQHSLMMNPYDDVIEVTSPSNDVTVSSPDDVTQLDVLPESSGLLRTRMDMFEVSAVGPSGNVRNLWCKRLNNCFSSAQVGPPGGVFRSTIDPNVFISFPPNAVEQTTPFTMQVSAHTCHTYINTHAHAHARARPRQHPCVCTRVSWCF